MYDKKCTSDDGHITSPNLTENQIKYTEIVSQLARTAVMISLRHGKFRVEAPDGMNQMLAALAKNNLSYDKLTPEQKDEYENRWLYETHSSQRLGNAASILQHLIYEAHQDHEIQEIFKQYLTDVKMIASTATTRYMDNKNGVNLA